MAYTTVNKSSDFFNTVLYTSTGNDNLAISGVGFEADLTWIKKRAVVSGSNTNEAHMWADQVRGYDKWISSSSNNPDQTYTAGLKSWQSDGFTLGTVNRVNQGSTPHTYAAWNWKAGGGQGSSNTDGSINTTYTSANTTAGFSISKYTGTGANATFGHGLGVKPDIVFWKRLDNAAGAVNWIVQSPLLGNQEKIVLNTTEAKSNNSNFSQTDNWTSALLDLKTYEGQNSSGGTYIAYAFASKTGYSKVGSYTGNGNASGMFCYLGFKPAYIMLKRTDTSGERWNIKDNKRDGYNQTDPVLTADASGAEYDDSQMDLLSNGFKIRTSAVSTNASGGTYIYIAFAEAPLVGSNNVPATAR